MTSIHRALMAPGRTGGPQWERSAEAERVEACLEAAQRCEEGCAGLLERRS